MGLRDVLENQQIITQRLFHRKNRWRINAERVIEWLPDKGKLLDIGCGDAKQTDMFLEKVDFTVGLDETVEDPNFDHKERKCKIVQGDATILPFEDGSFDVVTASGVLEHLENDLACVKEVQRVLKNDGTYIVSVPN